MLAERVALRSKIAAYFNVGDIILYGKYKNKRGRILNFGRDEKGNPTITIEPIPKGRKQNKTMGLYKIWKIRKEPTMDSVTHRVVNAYFRKQRIALDVGRTWENDQWRVHRYVDHIVVWDLTNAGKRGKKVPRWSVGSTARSFPFESTAMEIIMWAKRGASASQMRKVLDEIEEVGGHISETSERGVDVSPGGFAPVEIRGKHVRVEVGWKDFTIKNLDDEINEPTCIPAIKGGIRSIPAFYRWVQDNKSKIEKMDFREVLKAMDGLGVPYHEYCAMD